MNSNFNLERFFDWQIGNLKNGVVLKSESEEEEVLLHSKNTILDLAKSFGFENGNLPFLPVLSCQWFDLDVLMKNVKGGHFSGESLIRGIDIQDRIAHCLRKIYYLFDVEPGRKTLGIHPVVAKAKISKLGRVCMNVDEIISLGMHCNILKRCNIWAPESCNAKNDEEIIALTLLFRRPKLIFACPSNYNLWGVPSYKDSISLLW